MVQFKTVQLDLQDGPGHLNTGSILLHHRTIKNNPILLHHRTIKNNPILLHHRTIKNRHGSTCMYVSDKTAKLKLQSY